MDWLLNPEIWIGLVTLTGLEVVLGVDNIIFISLLSSKLPKEQQARARLIGLSLALITRILLILSIAWLSRLTKPLFVVGALEFSGRSIILLVGGLFLIAKATHEIHDKLEGEEGGEKEVKRCSFRGAIVQIVIIDIIFSLDSVITAVGMVRYVGVMVAAVVISIILMMLFAGRFSAFVDKHPTVQMLALAFLVLIGVNLLGDGLGHHLPKGYTYFAMAFSVVVEMLNMRMRAKHTAPVHLHRSME